MRLTVLTATTAIGKVPPITRLTNVSGQYT